MPRPPANQTSRNITQWQSPVGIFELHRCNADPTRSLQAWDAADSLILDTLLQGPGKLHALVINDEFGALTTALRHCQRIDGTGRTNLPVPVLSVNDSLVGSVATRSNLRHHGLDSPLVHCLPTTLQTPIDSIVLRIPKSLAMFEDQLHRLRALTKPGCQMTAGIMSKYLTRNMVDRVERIFGPATVSRAVRKARVVTASRDHSTATRANPFPVWQQNSLLPEPLLLRAGVFSLNRTDAASLLLCRHIRHYEGSPHIIDLGCGSGLLGLVAAQRNPQAVITMIDESWVAVASATFNAERLFPEQAITVAHANGLTPLADKRADMVLCNPPFHENRRITSATAEQMIVDTHRVLKPGGSLLLVGNRHLDYGKRLSRIFGRNRLLQQDRRFCVFEARKQQ